MNCRICGADLTGLDIEYHYGKNHLSSPAPADYVAGYRDACRMIAALREENERLRADIEARISLTHDHLDKLNVRERERDEANGARFIVCDAFDSMGEEYARISEERDGKA